MGIAEEEKLAETLKVLLKTCHKWVIVMSLSPEERAGLMKQTTFSMCCLGNVNKKEFLSICENLCAVSSELLKEYQKKYNGLAESFFSSTTLKDDFNTGPDK